MYKLILSHPSVCYNEAGQTNPLRWKILFLDGDTFRDQTDWFKCKDYFNDVVARLRGVTFSVYGFNNQSLKLADEGVYVLLNHLKPGFGANISIINEQLEKDLGCKLQLITTDKHSLTQQVWLIPKPIWENTYYVSLATWLIRLANNETVTRWQDFFLPTAPAQTVDIPGKQVIPRLLRDGFRLPDKFAHYWWYSGREINSENGQHNTSYNIHNCGIAAWDAAIRMEY